MPLIIAEGPQFPDEERRVSMIGELTEIASRNLGVSPRDVVVLIREEGGDRMAAGAGDTVAWDGKVV